MSSSRAKEESKDSKNELPFYDCEEANPILLKKLQMDKVHAELKSKTPEALGHLEEREMQAYAQQVRQHIFLRKLENLNDCRTYAAAISKCRGNVTFFKSNAELADSQKETCVKTALGVGTLFGLLSAISERNVVAGVVFGATMMTAIVDLIVHAANNYGAQEEHMDTLDQGLAKEYENRYMKL